MMFAVSGCVVWAELQCLANYSYFITVWPPVKSQTEQTRAQADAACDQVNWAMAIRMVMMAPIRASVPTVQRVMVIMRLLVQSASDRGVRLSD